jgi:hypothetical protein
MNPIALIIDSEKNHMHVENNLIKDDLGRTLILRGCNLGGSSKQPFSPNGASWHKESLQNTKNVSFTGRPFPLEEAESHLERLAGWGFTFIRFIITWEALEHEGPGIYDEEYLSYLRKVLNIAHEKGISIFMDPHQDVWSRWTGGDGAPAWTMEKLGMNIEKFDDVGAAITHQYDPKSYPKMIWPSNYSKYGTATMFTLFFGGNIYAPETFIEGIPVQDWLQEHYLAAMRHCYRRLKNCKAIVGWGSMNEPHSGYIGHQNIENMENHVVASGPMPSPFAAMAAASGFSMKVPIYTMISLSGPKIKGYTTINPKGEKLFAEGYECPFKKAGVWTDEGGTPKLLKPDHFSKLGGKPINFADDFLNPFINRFIDRMKDANEKCIFFIEGVPNKDGPSWKKQDSTPVVNAFHWYDGVTLYTKFFTPGFSINSDTAKIALGKKNVIKSFAEQLKTPIDWTKKNMGNMPCLLGEFGLPFDLNKKKAFKTGDYRKHEEALSMYYDAIDENLLHSTIWNYTADNSHEHGDLWNNEDLSIFHNGEGRAKAGWLRPYPMATAGIPESISWNRKAAVFTYQFTANPAISHDTEIFLPKEFIGESPNVTVKNPDGKILDSIKIEYHADKQRLFLNCGEYSGSLSVTVTKK